jgi:NDP-sugar pyrophosphorylase family protein
MKVVILCGGKGTRLREETEYRPKPMVPVGDLAGADRIMHEALFIGTYPGLTDAMLDYMIERITEFVRSK